MENQVVDTDSLTLEQIVELAKDQPAAHLAAQPRNEDGTFAAAPAVDPVPDATGTTTTTPDEDRDPNEVFRDGEWQYALTIPGEDGAGDEIFYGRGPDFGTQYKNAVEQLRQSKIHLNRKLRQQSQQIKEVVTAKAALTADERYVLAQRLQTEPDLVLDEAVTRRINSDPRILAAEEFTTQQKRQAAATAWLAANPDFHDTNSNGARMWKEMASNGVSGVPTAADMDKAFRSLQADGLLQTKPAGAPPVVTTPAPVRRSSGLPTRSTAVAAPVVANAVDPYKIPLEELMILANQQARQGK